MVVYTVLLNNSWVFLITSYIIKLCRNHQDQNDLNRGFEKGGPQGKRSKRRKTIFYLKRALRSHLGWWSLDQKQHPQLQKRRLQLPEAPARRRGEGLQAPEHQGLSSLRMAGTEEQPSAVFPYTRAPTTRPLLKPSARYLSPGLSVLFAAAAGAVLPGLRWQRGGDDPGAGDEGKPGLAGMQRLVMSAPLATAA